MWTRSGQIYTEAESNASKLVWFALPGRCRICSKTAVQPDSLSFNRICNPVVLGYRGWVKSPEGTATGSRTTDDKPNGIPNLFGYSWGAKEENLSRLIPLIGVESGLWECPVDIRKRAEGVRMGPVFRRKTFEGDPKSLLGRLVLHL